MRVFKFTFVEDPDYGAYGWRPDWQPTFSVNTGNEGVAHDILEHFPGTDASPASELLAFGAMWYGRGEMGMLGTAHIRDLDNISMAAIGVMQTCHDEGITLPTFEVQPIRDIDIDDRLLRIAEGILHYGKRELSAYSDYDDSDFSKYVDLPRIYCHLNRGYRMAARRYRAIGPARMVELFESIQIDTDRFCDEGDRMHVHLDVKRMTVTVRYLGPA